MAVPQSNLTTDGIPQNVADMRREQMIRDQQERLRQPQSVQMGLIRQEIVNQEFVMDQRRREANMMEMNPMEHLDFQAQGVQQHIQGVQEQKTQRYQDQYQEMRNLQGPRNQGN